MDVLCLTCKRKIEAANINVAKDTAYCISCESLTELSSLLQSETSKSFDKNSSVPGTAFTDEGYRWRVEASHRSGMALFYIPFTCVWAGGSLFGIYGQQIINAEFDLHQSLFGIPFLLGSILLIALSLMSVFGRTLVSVENDRTLLFVGIGAIGWYRRFDWTSIDRIIETTATSNRSNGQSHYISLEGKTRINLGWGLSSSKLYFVANILRSKLKT
jgi:hypothetical protein